ERIYDSIGEAQRFGKFEWDDGHGYLRPRREAAYRWFSRWLQGKEDTAPEAPVTVLDEQELWATKEGQVALAFSNNKTVFDLNQDRFTAVRARNPQPDAVRKYIGFAPAAGAPRVRNYGVIQADGYSIEKLVYEPEPGIQIPALLYEPAGQRGKLAATILTF